MGEAVNKLNLKQALEGAKTYVDNQATAHVIRTETALFDGEASVSSANNLNQPISDFDAVRIVASAKNPSTEVLWSITSEEYDIADVVGSLRIQALETDDPMVTYYSLNVRFPSDTTFTVDANVSANWQNSSPTVRKIYGVKYTVPETYSTTEQVVGTWIDGKPLYQKICVYDVAGQCEINTWTDIPVPNLPTDIETHVDVTVSNGDNIIPMAAGVFNDKLRYYTNAAYGWRKLYVTLKYTKTTDTGGA